jgi:hypothetical protein
VRDRAAAALGKLMKLSPRVDQLIKELVNGSQAKDVEPGVQVAMLQALSKVLANAGGSASKPPLEAALPVLLNLSGSPDTDDARPFAAACFAQTVQWLGDAAAVAAVGEHVLPNSTGSILVSAAPAGRHGKALIMAGLFSKASVLEEGGVLPACLDAVKEWLADDNLAVKCAAADCVVPLALNSSGQEYGVAEVLLPVCALLQDPASDAREACLTALKRMAKLAPTDSKAVPLPAAICAVFRCAAVEKNSAVKYGTERALMYLMGLHVPQVCYCLPSTFCPQLFALWSQLFACLKCLPSTVCPVKLTTHVPHGPAALASGGQCQRARCGLRQDAGGPRGVGFHRLRQAHCCQVSSGLRR